MNIWFRRLLLILMIGGGFGGIMITLTLASRADGVIAYTLVAVFIALYVDGIFVGVKLSEGTPPLKHLRAYFILQVPIVSSPFIIYRFCSGLQATVLVLQPGLQLDCRLGSEWQFYLFATAPWGAGVNFVALGIVLLLYSRFASSHRDLQGPKQSLEPIPGGGTERLKDE